MDADLQEIVEPAIQEAVDAGRRSLMAVWQTLLSAVRAQLEKQVRGALGDKGIERLAPEMKQVAKVLCDRWSADANALVEPTVTLFNADIGNTANAKITLFGQELEFGKRKKPKPTATEKKTPEGGDDETPLDPAADKKDQGQDGPPKGDLAFVPASAEKPEGEIGGTEEKETDGAGDDETVTGHCGSDDAHDDDDEGITTASLDFLTALALVGGDPKGERDHVANEGYALIALELIG